MSDRYPHVPERNKRICARYDEASDLTFEELGNEFNLDRETVRQIVRKHAREREAAKRRAPLIAAFAKGVGRQIDGGR